VKKSTLVGLGIAALGIAGFSYWTLQPDDPAVVTSEEEPRPIPGAPSAGSGAQQAIQTELAPVSKQTYELPSTHAVGVSYENDGSAERNTARAP
jgi:hypothetical protein